MPGTIEAPPNEGGDSRAAEAAVVRGAELMLAGAGVLAEKEDEKLTDEAIRDFFDAQTQDNTERTEPKDERPKETPVQGSKAIFVQDSENYGYQGSAILGNVMPGGIRNRVAGIEGRAFRQRWLSTYAGQQTVRHFISRVAIL